jgi:beta-1,4-N-acetylglucosaminyltransferase
MLIKLVLLLLLFIIITSKMSLIFLPITILITLILLKYLRILLYKGKSIMIILGSGGHTGELLIMISKLNIRKFEKVYFVISHNDNSSENKAKELLHIDDKRVQFLRIYRSRNVGQSYFSSIFTTQWALLHGVCLILKTRPNMVDHYLMLDCH